MNNLTNTIEQGAASGKCSLHDGMVDWLKEERENRKEERRELNAKLDQMFIYQATNHDEIMKVKHIVSNGLQDTTKRTAFKLEELCNKVTVVCDQNDKHFASIDEFKWFRDWVNNLRNHMFKYAVMTGVAGGGIWAAIYYGRELTASILKGI
jgi:hypothetical protein